jgi:hypothetical protein
MITNGGCRTCIPAALSDPESAQVAAGSRPVLMAAPPPRRSPEAAEDATPDGMQRLLNRAEGDADAVRDDLRDDDGVLIFDRPVS